MYMSVFTRVSKISAEKDCGKYFLICSVRRAERGTVHHVGRFGGENDPTFDSSSYLAVKLGFQTHTSCTVALKHRQL